MAGKQRPEAAQEVGQGATTAARAAVGWREIGWMALWGAALYGTLQIARITGPWDHAICGAWGCGPPLSALVACHGFWAVLIGGTVTAVMRYGSAPVLAVAGRLLMAGGMVGLVALALWEGTSGLTAPDQSWWPYALQRYLFVLATSVDMPLLQIIAAGAMMAKGGRAVAARQARQSSAEVGEERGSATAEPG